MTGSKFIPLSRSVIKSMLAIFCISLLLCCCFSVKAGLKEIEKAIEIKSDTFLPCSLKNIQPGIEKSENKTRLLVVSKNVKDWGMLVNAVQDGIKTVSYDPKKNSLDQLLGKIKTALNGKQADSIALVNHDYGLNKFYLTKSETISLASTLNSKNQKEFWEKLGDMVKKDGRIDLLACNLAKGTEGAILISALEKLTNRNIAASTNETGNNKYNTSFEQQSIDWCLETDHIDIAKIYFAQKEINVFTGKLASVTQKLKITGGSQYDHFGYSVAISGDTAVVGMPGDHASSSEFSGQVYIFIRSGNNWVQSAKLSASDGVHYDYFGRSVAIDGDTVVVGSEGDNYQTGSVYVFVKPGATWVDMTQTAKLTADDGDEDDYFGYSVAIDGDTIVIGADRDDDQGGWSGSAYVFLKPGEDWVDMNQTSKLTASDGAELYHFGISVAISGNTIIVGANCIDNNLPGRAYLFTRSGENWTQAAKLTASDEDGSNHFGHSVAISGDTVVASTYYDNDDPNGSSAYVFLKPGTGWVNMTQTAKLIPDDIVDVSARFGKAVAIDGDTIVVGAEYDDDNGRYSGSLYIFEKPGANWSDMSQTIKLTPNDGEAYDYFASSVAIDGSDVIVGSHWDYGTRGSAYIVSLITPGINIDTNSRVVGRNVPTVIPFSLHDSDTDLDSLVLTGQSDNPNVIQNSNIVFTGSGANRTLTITPETDAEGITHITITVSDGSSESLKKITFFTGSKLSKLTASDGATADYFGHSVAICGDTAVVGAYLDDYLYNGHDIGSAYVFIRSGGSWTQVAKLTALDREASTDFGISVAIDGDTIVIGSRDNNNDKKNVYIFEKPGDVWTNMTETVQLTASNLEDADAFGNSVSISGDTIVVGSLGDNDDINGVNSGSAYVYVKPETGWVDNMTQTAKLTASDGEYGASFGTTVSISGDTVVIGTNYYSDDDENESAYVFVKPASGWTNTTETAKLTPFDGGGYRDHFGISVTISDDTIVVSASGDHAYPGCAYVFVKPGAGWESMNETAKLLLDEGEVTFGDCVAISGDTIVVSGTSRVNHDYDFDYDDNYGNVYVFVKPETGWATMTQSAKLIADDGRGNDGFGYQPSYSKQPSLAISGDTLIVGAYVEDGDSFKVGGAFGSAYVITLDLLPSLSTAPVTSIDLNTATANGSIDVQSNPPSLAHGFCWHTSNNPTTNENHSNEGAVTATGAFSSSITGLSPGTTYWLRPYVSNGAWTVYGAETSFTTINSTPIISTSDISSITNDSAASGGTITGSGGENVTARGVCWSTSPTPTTANSHTTDGTGTGAFTSSITSLNQNATYYVRAYAANVLGTSYGNEKTFTTGPTPPIVSTKIVYNITSITATGNGNITDLGAPNPTQYGVCWSTSTTPTTADSKTEEGAATATGAFTSNITGLSSNTAYYLRAYATNSSGTVYGADVSFSTDLEAPTVTTQDVTAITTITATGNGNIIDLGAPNPTQYGVCWSTSYNPTTVDTKTEEGVASATGAFTSDITNLTHGNHYYTRAYAINAAGTVYGYNVSFTTKSSIPWMVFDTHTHVTKMNTPTAALLCSIFDNDSPTDSLVLYGTSDNQSIVNNANIVFGGSGSDRTVTITPVTDAEGLVNITLTVSDGTYQSQKSFPLIVAGKETYVKHDAAGVNDGTSWTDAFTDLQLAIDSATYGEEVWVAKGTYKPTSWPNGGSEEQEKHFALKNGVAVYGGFAGSETSLDQRDTSANITILSGDFNGDDVVTGSGKTLSITGNDENAYHVFYNMNLTIATILDGVTISGGNANPSLSSGGAILNLSSQLKIQNSVFTANSAYRSGAIAGGRVINCTFSNNSATYYGACSAGSLTGSIFIGNRASMDGGAISSSNITNCTFVENYAARHGGVMLHSYSDSVIVTNCTFLENSARDRGGVFYNEYSDQTVTNCIFDYNQCNKGSLSYNIYSTLSIKNCVL